MAPVRAVGHIVFVALLLIVTSSQCAAAASLIKLWELDLSRWNKNPGGNAEKFPVRTLSFSPDGNRIALTGTEIKNDNGQLSGRLLVAQIGARVEDVESFEAIRGSDFADWSPSGDAVVVNGLLVRLASRATCNVPDNSRFISEDELIGQSRGPNRSSRFAIYDKNCRSSKTWETPEEWYITDVSIERHLLLMNKPLQENLLVDSEGGRVVRRWSMGKWPLWDGPGGNFADAGAALCGSVGDDFEDVPKGRDLRCWKTDTGELIGYAPADRAAAPVSVSRRSTRVVFSEYGYIRGVIRDRDSHPYKDAAVWDYGTGERLASLIPDTQTWYELGLHPPKKIVEASKFAISPDGQYVAEGGNGKLTVYKIQR